MPNDLLAEVLLDVSDLEPPEPLEQTLEVADQLLVFRKRLPIQLSQKAIKFLLILHIQPFLVLRYPDSLRQNSQLTDYCAFFVSFLEKRKNLC